MPPSLWPDRVRVAAWAALVLLVVAPRVTGFTTDSDAYLDVARTLLAGHGLAQSVVDFWRPALPDPLGLWPPVFPLAIAALGALGVPLATAARLLAELGFVGFALAFHALALRAGGRAFAFVTTLIVLLGPGLAQAGATAWSEPLYLLFLTLGLVASWDLAQAPGVGPVVRRATLAGLWLGLAADTRYLGLALVPVLFLLLLSARVRGRPLAWWTAGAVLPAVPWLAHNLLIFGRLTGPGLPAATQPLGHVARILAGSVRREFLPEALAHFPALGLPALALLAVAVVWALRAGGLVRWAAAVALAELAFVLLATWRTGINDPAGRYTLVAWPYFGLVAAAAAWRAIRLLPERRARLAAPITAALALLAVGAGLGKFLATSASPPRDAVARREAQVALARLVPAGDAPILGDTGHLLRLATGRPAVQVPPARFRVREFTADDARRWSARGVTQAVFRHDARDGMGDYLAGKLSGGWAIEDSAGGFVRYRIEP